MYSNQSAGVWVEGLGVWGQSCSAVVRAPGVATPARGRLAMLGLMVIILVGVSHVISVALSQVLHVTNLNQFG